MNLLTKDMLRRAGRAKFLTNPKMTHIQLCSICTCSTIVTMASTIRLVATLIVGCCRLLSTTASGVRQDALALGYVWHRCLVCSDYTSTRRCQAKASVDFALSVCELDGTSDIVEGEDL